MLPLIDSPSLPAWLRGTLNGLVFLASLVMLERSADIFVDSTAIVAKRFGLPTVLVGLLTAGAEWEELAVVISSLAQHNPSLALSNIYGSSIANILGSFSIGLLFAPSSLEGVELSSARIYTTLLVVLSICIAALALPPVRKVVGSHAGRPGLIRGRVIGGVLVGVFVIYVAGIAYGIYRGIVIAPEDSDSDSDDGSDDDSSDDEVAPRAVIVPPSASDRTPLLTSHPQDPSTPRSIIPHIRKSTIHHLILLIISTILLSLSGYLLASTTTNLAILLGLYQSTAGLTILSIATTLPEKLVAFKAGMKKQSGVLVANTVGSCVFLGTLVLGIVYLVRGEAAYENDTMSLVLSIAGDEVELEGKAELLDVCVVLASAVILWAIVWYGKFKRWFGVGMLIAYIGYLVSVVVRSK